MGALSFKRNQDGHLGHLADHFLTSKGASPMCAKTGTLGTLAPPGQTMIAY